MSEHNSTNAPRDQENWAHKNPLNVDAVPSEAINLNVHGRQVVGPLQGFGQLWQKTYRMRLTGSTYTPEQVIASWKANFPAFQPPNNRFFPSVAGVTPGAVVLINASMQGMPIQTGVLVLYADDLSFTLMTPQGHPESGWVTFSAWDDAGITVVQIQSIARANDPIYELGFILGGSAAQEAIWQHVLRRLADHHGAIDPLIQMERHCVDDRLQWRQIGNIWHNAAIRSVLYALARPFRGH